MERYGRWFYNRPLRFPPNRPFGYELWTAAIMCQVFHPYEQLGHTMARLAVASLRQAERIKELEEAVSNPPHIHEWVYGGSTRDETGRYMVALCPAPCRATHRIPVDLWGDAPFVPRLG